MPSAPCVEERDHDRRARSMLASSRTATPSAVTAGSAARPRLAPGLRRRPASRCASSISAGLGSTAELAGRCRRSPPAFRRRTRWLASCRPTTAGTLSDRARIAVWWVRLPASVAKPSTRDQSSCAASDAVSSSAMSTAGPSISLQQVGGPRPGAAVPQVHAHPAGDVGDVALALAQVRILDGGEHRAQFLVGAMHRPGGVDAVGFDQRARPAEEHRVVEHEQLRVEQRAPGRGRARRSARSRMSGAAARCERSAGVSRASTSWSTRSGRNRKAHHLGPLGEDDGAAHGDAGRDAEAGQSLHVSSPNPVRPAPPATTTRRPRRCRRR